MGTHGRHRLDDAAAPRSPRSFLGRERIASVARGNGARRASPVDDAAVAELIEFTTTGLAVLSGTGEFRFANSAFYELFALPDTRTSAGDPDRFDVTPATLPPIIAELIERIRGVPEILIEELIVETPDAPRKLRVSARWLAEDAHTPETILLDVEDWTAQSRAQQQLALAEHVYETAGEGIVMSDENGVILAVNDAYARMCGRSRGECVGLHVSESMLVHPDSIDTYERLWRSIRTSGHWQGELWRVRATGEAFPQWITVNRVFDSGDAHYIATVSDLTEIHESRRHSEYLLTHDPLTGLTNRALFHDRLERALAAADSAPKSYATGVLYLDLDRFKHINDTLGHDVGDQLLVAVSRRLESLVRPADTVARVGGDEFAVLIEGSSVREIEAIANRVLRALREPFEVGGRRIDTRGSIGVAFAPHDGATATELAQAADMALYRAKDNGRDQVAAFSQSMQDELIARIDMESHLREDLETGRLRLVFQPQFSASTDVLLGLEVLLRWTDRHGVEVSPDIFIPVAESTHLIVDIDYFVIKHALQAVADLGRGDLTTAVNVSATSLRDPEFAHTVRSILEEFGVDPRCLILEVTERALVGENGPELSSMETLHDLGVQFSIDDFGTGFSSLAYLKRLPINEVKIDRTFVDGLGIAAATESSDASIAEAIIYMAQSLHLRTVAEGVETEAQAAWLRGHGCHVLQGFHLGRPEPIEGIHKRLTEREERDQAQ